MSASRVVVAIDGSLPSLAAAEAAAEVAAALGVELHGLFVEDADLLRFAELPGAVETDRLSGSSRPIVRADLELQLRAQGERARAGFERAAAGRGVLRSFRVARGRVAAEILAAAGRRDVLALGQVGFAGGERLGSAARAVAGARGAVLLLAGPIAAAGRRRPEPAAHREQRLTGGEALAEVLRRLLDRLEGPVLLVR